MSQSRELKISRKKAILGIILCFLLIGASCPPKIENFTPEEGEVGDEVTIKGKRFGETVAENTVKFGGVTASDITVPQTNMIIAKVPTGAKTGLISVTRDNKTGYSSKNFVVIGEAEWTFIVYVDGDNNLEGAAMGDFLEMASVGSTPEVNIVVQVDRRPGFSSGYGDWEDTRRFHIQQGDDPSVAPAQNLGEQNMGDPAVLQDFVEWAVTNYPAEHYALVIWNHGDGWKTMKEKMIQTARAVADRSAPGAAVSRAIASDDTDGDVLYMKEVQNALKNAKERLQDRLGTQVKLDIVGFDACLMGMIEVAYAMRDVADYMVGSEDLEPFNGWPYDLILGALSGNPAYSPGDLAKEIVNKYGLSYPNDNSITQSSVDVARLQNLVTAINNFTSVANTDWANLKDARNNTDTFHPTGYPNIWGVDLWDFANEVVARTQNSAISQAAVQIKTAINDFVTNEYHGSNWANSKGIAIYFPPTQTEYNNDPDHTAYQDSNTFMIVDFVKNNNWDNWLQTFYSNI
jgi:hypothetical protein